MASKICRVCKKEKPLEGLVKNKRVVDGRENFCKSCRSIAERKRWREDLEKNREYKRLWANSHYKYELSEEEKQNRQLAKVGKRKCIDCGSIKDFQEFRPDSGSKGGVRRLCRECSRIREGKFREDNRSKLREYQYEWCKANPDKVKENQKRYKQRHPESNVKATARYRETLWGRFITSVYAVKNRGGLWEIEYDDWEKLISPNMCHYCNGPLGDRGARLDQKIPRAGYTLKNVVPCCLSCNIIKSNRLTYEEMVVAMQAVCKFRFEKSQSMIKQEGVLCLTE